MVSTSYCSAVYDGQEKNELNYVVAQEKDAQKFTQISPSLPEYDVEEAEARQLAVPTSHSRVTEQHKEVAPASRGQYVYA